MVAGRGAGWRRRGGGLQSVCARGAAQSDRRDEHAPARALRGGGSMDGARSGSGCLLDDAAVIVHAARLGVTVSARPGSGAGGRSAGRRRVAGRATGPRARCGADGARGGTAVSRRAGDGASGCVARGRLAVRPGARRRVQQPYHRACARRRGRLVRPPFRPARGGLVRGRGSPVGRHAGDEAPFRRGARSRHRAFPAAGTASVSVAFLTCGLDGPRRGPGPGRPRALQSLPVRFGASLRVRGRARPCRRSRVRDRSVGQRVRARAGHGLRVGRARRPQSEPARNPAPAGRADRRLAGARAAPRAGRPVPRRMGAGPARCAPRLLAPRPVHGAAHDEREWRPHGVCSRRARPSA